MVGLILVLISCFIYLFFLYNDIQQSRTTHYQDAKDKVLKMTEVTQIDNVTVYNGRQQFHVIFGATKNGENKIVYVPSDKKDKDLTVVDMSKIIKKQQIKNQWKEQCQNCELINITPAMEDGKPLWEVTYVDAADRYIFDYLSIYDGTRSQQLRLKSIFH
ncbi:hypothetical protein CFK37_14950 [Virgibacillus phasianinus]|uniref:Cell wall elongation regulator TseB-like domain-containing protein n=2 Tax=Virgibacillus phasianinus TaxID=2017483 RepID=A0A220U5V7_9BACI|nr:hypothetical protein CFK37_14950 [Virgibacillus phasianinus]